MIHLHEVPKEVKIIETESRMVVAKGWREEGMRSYCLIGYGVLVCNMKRVLEMYSGDGCTTM